MLPIFGWLYRIGLFICGAQGYQNRDNWHPATIVSAAYGGGWLRDIFILKCDELAFFAPDTNYDILAVWAGALFQALYGSFRWFQTIKFLLDPPATGVFVVIGVSAAQAAGADPITAIASGIVTALGGGVYSKVLSGRRMRNVISLNMEYKLIVVAATILYTIWTYTGTPPFEAQLSAILIVGLSNTMIAPQFQYIIKRLVEEQVLWMPLTPQMFLLRCWLHGIYAPHRALATSVLPKQPQSWHRVPFHLMQPA